MFFYFKILFLLIFFIAFIYIFFYTEKNKTPLANSSFQIQTPCRKLTQQNPLKTFSNRVEKLNHLMDSKLDWILPDLQQKEWIDFYCLRNKKRIVLNFWATWCTPCIKELPSLSKLAKSYKNDIFVIAVSTEDKKKVQNFLTRSFKELSSELKITVIKEDEKLKYFPKDSLPATYIFNKQGFLKIKVLGEKDWSNKKIVQQILELN
ncbi:MAG: TlpA family protein disulfide reductase [Bdellovibrionales bacterium]|nr:TlpA family protein disulfide reductase [Bdellovibrionales bacterium]